MHTACYAYKEQLVFLIQFVIVPFPSRFKTDARKEGNFNERQKREALSIQNKICVLQIMDFKVMTLDPSYISPSLDITVHQRANLRKVYVLRFTWSAFKFLNTFCQTNKRSSYVHQML